MLDDGIIIKVKNGLYRLSDSPAVCNRSFIDISRAVPEGVICLLSALSYYDLTTYTPEVISVAIYRESWKPMIKYPPVEFYLFSLHQFEECIDVVLINKQKIRIYSPEKTVCDCIRYRNKLGLDMAKEGLTAYLKTMDRDLEELMRCAEICRIGSLLRKWLEIIV